MKITARKYAQALVEVLKNEKDQKVINEKIQNLIKILVKRKETKTLKRFQQIFKSLWMREKGQLEVKLTLPHKPDDSNKLALIKSLGSALDKEIILNVHIDENVIGGMKIEFEDYVIDGTVSKSLEMLKTNLINTTN